MVRHIHELHSYQCCGVPVLHGLSYNFQSIQQQKEFLSNPKLCWCVYLESLQLNITFTFHLLLFIYWYSKTTIATIIKCSIVFSTIKIWKKRNFVLWMSLNKASNWAWVAVTWSNSLFGNISTSGQPVFRRTCHTSQTKNESKSRWLRKRKKFNKVWSVHFPY